MSSQSPGGGPGGIGPPPDRTDTAEQTLTMANAKWMRANRQALDNHLPAPDRCWKWGDTNLSQSVLCELQNRGLIKQCSDGRDGWLTTTRCWRALNKYGESNAEDRGEIVGQESLDQYIEEAQKRDW